MGYRRQREQEPIPDDYNYWRDWFSSTPAFLMTLAVMGVLAVLTWAGLYDLTWFDIVLIGLVATAQATVKTHYYALRPKELPFGHYMPPRRYAGSADTIRDILLELNGGPPTDTGKNRVEKPQSPPTRLVR